MSERSVFVRVEGRVQGVGFRAFAQREASRLGIAGWVVNCADGSVEAALYGPGAALGEMVAALRKGPLAARIDSLDVRSCDAGRAREAPAGGVAF